MAEEERGPVVLAHGFPSRGVGEGLEVVLPGRPRREEQEHGRRLARFVPEAVDAPDRHVEEVARTGVDPAAVHGRPLPHAQQAVAGILPSLPEDIVGVVTQGGDGYGAAQAFEDAGRPRPVIIMGNRQDELAWWKEQKDANGYETMSVSIAPGVSTLAFWVAQQILDGKEVPKDLTVPFLRIDQDTLEANLEATEPGGVANVEYSLEDAQKVIDGGGAS